MAYGKMSSQELLRTARGVRGRMDEPDFVRDIAIGDESAKVRAARPDAASLAAAKGKLVEGFASMFGGAFAPTIDIAKKGGFGVAQQRWERGKALKKDVASAKTRLVGADPMKARRRLAGTGASVALNPSEYKRIYGGVP